MRVTLVLVSFLLVLHWCEGASQADSHPRTCRSIQIVRPSNVDEACLSKTYLTCSEWLAHQHRDTLSSIVGHPTLTSFLAIADGESIGRIKFEMTEDKKKGDRRHERGS